MSSENFRHLAKSVDFMQFILADSVSKQMREFCFDVKQANLAVKLSSVIETYEIIEAMSPEVFRAHISRVTPEEELPLEETYLTTCLDLIAYKKYQAQIRLAVVEIAAPPV